MSKTILTNDAGRWISEQIIESITEPDYSELADAGLALSNNQIDLLTELNRDYIYLTFGRPQSWNGYTEFAIVDSFANVQTGNTTVIFTGNVASNIFPNDTIIFTTVNTSPITTIGPFSVINVNSSIISINTSPQFGNTVMSASISRSNFDDINVPNASISVHKAMFSVWNSMIGGKLLTGNDMALVVPRHDWTANTIYSRYDALDPLLYNKQFYVLTSEYHVYKCLDNNGNSPSTEEPSTIPSTDWREVQKTNDGYVWKYMFSLDVSDVNFTQKFLTTDWMPVKFLGSEASEPLHQWDVQEAAVDGAIDNILIANGGGGFVVPSDGPLTVSFVGGGGSGAEGNAEVSPTGEIASIIITSEGAGYGTNLSPSLTATVNTKILTHTGNNILDTYNGSYITGNVIPANTYITAIENSSSPKKVYISANATSNGPVGSCVISGYPRIVIENGGGQNATAIAILSGDHIDSLNGGAIITNAGADYVPPIIVSIIGDGSNAHAFVDSTDISLEGAILNIELDTRGNGYTNTTVSIEGGKGSNAQAMITAGPVGGHGSDPVSELGAHSLMISVPLNGDEGGNLAISLANDYRQVSLLLNPFKFGTTDRANATSFMQTYSVSVTPGVTDYVEDEVVFQQQDVSESLEYSAIVEKFDVANNVLYLTNVYRQDGISIGFIPDITLPLKGAISTAFRNIITYSNPYLKPYSGKVLYLQNMAPIVRNEAQVEYIRIVINQ